MLRLNSTVMALSPLGKRRGGGSVAAMASELSRKLWLLVLSMISPEKRYPLFRIMLGSTCSVFWARVEFASREISQ
jgi:hypothetical protein